MNTPIVPSLPPSPAEAIRAYQGCRERAEQQLRDATDAEARLLAQFWIDLADRNLTKWYAQAYRDGQR